MSGRRAEPEVAIPNSQRGLDSRAEGRLYLSYARGNTAAGECGGGGRYSSRTNGSRLSPEPSVLGAISVPHYYFLV